jgi:acetylornithine deacetylase
MKPVHELLIDLIRIPSVSVLSNVPVIDYIVETRDSKIWNLYRLPYCDAAGIPKQNLLATPIWLLVYAALLPSVQNPLCVLL